MSETKDEIRFRLSLLRLVIRAGDGNPETLPEPRELERLADQIPTTDSEIVPVRHGTL